MSSVSMGVQESISEAPPSEVNKNIFPAFLCQAINKSEKGLGIECLSSEDLSIQAGEIVGLKRGSKPTIEIGIIRWTQRDTQGKWNFGVDLIAAEAQAGSIQLIKEGQATGYYLRCIYIYKEGASLLLTPSVPFKVGSTIAIKYGNRETPLQTEITELVDITHNYKIFIFKEETAPGIDTSDNEIPPEEPKDPELKAPGGSGDFDGIWSSL